MKQCFHLQQYRAALFVGTLLSRWWGRSRKSGRDPKIRSQSLRCLFHWQAEQPGGEVDHIAVGPAAKAVKSLIQLHAGMAILMERTAGHAVTIYSQPIVFCGLTGCDEAFDSFEVYEYSASLLSDFGTGNDLNSSSNVNHGETQHSGFGVERKKESADMQFSGHLRNPGNGMEQISSDEVRKYARYGRFQGAVVFRLSCFRFCKSIRLGVKALQEIDKIAILQEA